MSLTEYLLRCVIRRATPFAWLLALMPYGGTAYGQQNYLVQPAVATYATYGLPPVWYEYVYNPTLHCYPLSDNCGRQWRESRDAETLCTYAVSGGLFTPADSSCAPYSGGWSNGVYWVNSQVHVAHVDRPGYTGPVCRFWRDVVDCRGSGSYSRWEEAQLGVTLSCPDATWTLMNEVCYKALPNPDTDDCSVGNPIAPSIEAKQSTDIDTSLIEWGRSIPVTREFSSRSLVEPSGALGFGWRLMPWERKLQFIRGYWDPLNVIALRSVSSTLTFTRPPAGFAETGTGWTQQNSKPAVRLSRHSVSGVSTDWTIKDDAGLMLERYSASGRLDSIQYPDGSTASLIYSDVPAPRPGNLTSIVFSSGRRIEFSYSATGEMSAIEIPARAPAAATTLTFTYEQRAAPLLTSRTIAGETLTYLYEDLNNPFQTTLPGNLYTITSQPSWPRYPSWFCSYCPLTPGKATLNALSALTAPRSPYSITGIVDEKSVRESTYKYDAQGRAISTERAGGVNKYQINYASPTSVAITDPLNTVRTRTYQTINGVVHSVNETQPPGSGSGACSRSGTFDSAGNPISRLDYNGNKICYVYDATRAVETKRVEGLASTASCTTALTNPPAGGRVISTEWHPYWQLPTRVAEPQKITTTVFNGQGATCAPNATLLDGSPVTVMCSRTEQATTDETGAAASVPRPPALPGLALHLHHLRQSADCDRSEQPTSPPPAITPTTIRI